MVIFDKRESLHQNEEFVNNVDVTVKVTDYFPSQHRTKFRRRSLGCAHIAVEA